jgi:hypothetical protein
MLERLCKDLGLRFDGRWEAVGGYQFTIINPKLVCKGTSIVVFDTDKLTLINKMNEIETLWINVKIKEVRNNA